MFNPDICMNSRSPTKTLGFFTLLHNIINSQLQKEVVSPVSTQDMAM